MSYTDYNENLSNVQVSVVDASIRSKTDVAGAGAASTPTLRNRLMGDTMSTLSSMFASAGLPPTESTSAVESGNVAEHADSLLRAHNQQGGGMQPPAGPNNAHTRGLVSVWVSFLCFIVFGILYLVCSYRAARKIRNASSDSTTNSDRDNVDEQTASVRGQRETLLTSNDLLAQVRPLRTGPSATRVIGRAERTDADPVIRPMTTLATMWLTMSSWSWVTIFAVATVASFLWFLASLVWFSSSTNSNLDAMANTAGDRMVQVVANGRVQAFPDRIILQICETTTRHPVINAAASAEALRIRVSDLVSHLRTHLHVPSSDIHLQAVGTHAIYAPRNTMTYGGFDYIVPLLQTSSTQYVSTQTILVDTLFVPDRINTLLEILSTADVNFTMSFQLSDASQQLQQGLAVDAATRHAADLAAHAAESADVTLGPILSIDVVRSNGFPSIQPITLVSTTMQGSDISMILDPLTHSKVIVSAQVIARYSLRE